MMKEHKYQAVITWTGNLGKGTSSYREYERSHSVEIEGKKAIEASSDPAFRGDSSKHNPEDLFLSSISSCHMLWFLHLCTVEKIVVTNYIDRAEGIMKENKDGSGFFEEVTLKPEVTVLKERMAEKLDSLHEKANKMCFIANSCNFPIHHKATSKTALAS